MDAAERVVLITGASSGVGAALATKLAEMGARVVVNYSRSAEAAEAVVTQITAAGGQALAVQADVSEEADCKRLVATTVEHYGQLDVLVNNAGAELNKTYDETTVDEWDKVLDTDLKGPWLLCKYFVPRMVERGSGSVINVASLNGLVGFPLSTAYGSAKGGLVVFTRDMAIELASSGVRINCVCPGVIETPMMERWTDLMPDKAEAQAMLRGVMPIGRMGTAEEVAGAILFFASADSTLCQGAVRSVDGGFTAQ